jgi:ubiquinone/menaquinone biosynthesis C-methylase UbiE
MEEKLKHELRFWTNVWRKNIEENGFFNGDISELFKQNNRTLFKDDGFKNEAFAQLFRIEKEFKIKRDIFKNRKVLEIGPGAVQFIEICGAKISVGVDPLSNRFKELGMINNFSKDTIYLDCCAEKIPLLNSYFDIILSRNCLDHVNNPEKVILEMSRLLKKGGSILLSTDINHKPTKTEPLVLKREDILKCLKKVKIKILMEKIDENTYNFKKGKRLILKGVKYG